MTRVLALFVLFRAQRASARLDWSRKSNKWERRYRKFNQYEYHKTKRLVTEFGPEIQEKREYSVKHYQRRHRAIIGLSRNIQHRVTCLFDQTVCLARNGVNAQLKITSVLLMLFRSI